jgi:hypothetical protein
VLLDAGESIEDQMALLERAHCLSTRALAERSTVAALLDQTTRAFNDAISAGGPTPEEGGPWLCDAVRDLFRASGYLDELAWATLESGASPENPRVRWIIAQVRGTQDQGAGVKGPGGKGAGGEAAGVKGARGKGAGDKGAGGEVAGGKGARAARSAAVPAAAPAGESLVAALSAVTAPKSPAPAAPAGAASETVTCSLCRRELPPRAVFCGYCGHRLG